MEQTHDLARHTRGPIGAERRERYDRRRMTLRTFIQGGLTPRRRGSRRAGDQACFVDWHEPHLLFLALTILLLNVIDAFLTVTLISVGAQEANPVMAFVLDDFPRLFAVVKMSLTGIGLVVLVAVARAQLFNLIRVSTVMHWFVIAYGVLIVYEWWLLQSL
jgi:Domain of unknown function (DUF5658)